MFSKMNRVIKRDMLLTEDILKTRVSLIAIGQCRVPLSKRDKAAKVKHDISNYIFLSL